MVDYSPTRRIAYAIQRQTSSRKVDVFCARYADTMTFMVELVYKWYEQGYFLEAEPVAVKIVEFRREVFGSDHPGTKAAMADLAFRWNE